MDHLTPEERELANQKLQAEALQLMEGILQSMVALMGAEDLPTPPILEQLQNCLEVIDYPEVKGIRPILDAQLRHLLVQVWTEAFDDDIFVSQQEVMDLMGVSTVMILLYKEYLVGIIELRINPELLKVPTT